MPTPEHPTIAAADSFRTGLLRLERETAVRLVRAYGLIYQRLQAQILALDAEIAADPKAWKAGKSARLRALQRQVEAELAEFAVYADREIAIAAERAMERGIANSRQLVLAGMPEPLANAVSAVWTRLPTDAIQVMVGFLGPDTPLTASIQAIGPAVAQEIADALVAGIALGYNPRKVASIIQGHLGHGLTWALRTSRTAQLWAYREATRASYVANSDIVKGWVWHAKLGDGRTCLSCIEQHGTLYPPDAVLNDHHNGRCAMVPVTKSWSELGFRGIPDTNPQIEAGPDWFKRQPATVQRSYFRSKSMWEAYQDGRVDFGDFSVPYTDAIYGEMLREASLKGILGRKAVQYYRKAA